jgi:hypothetical protein
MHKGDAMNLLRSVLHLITLFCLAFGIAAPVHPSLAATLDIGKVIAYTSGATMLREGKTEALALHAGIRVSDTIQTDAGGRVKILFNDDSSVSLGPNTTMDMNEYADAGDKPSFGIHVPQGMVRAITGKIVDQNPDGFKMSSPEATVGIRGTIVTMHVEKGQGEQRGRTTVFVENTLRRVLVNGDNVPSGFKWIHSGGSSRQERITPEDRRTIGKEMAFRGGQGAAAAAPEAGRDGGRRTGTEQLVASRGSLLPHDADLKNIPLGTQSLGDSLSTTPTTATLFGHFTHDGTISHPQILSFGGNFTLSVNLSTGNVTGSQISANGVEWSASPFAMTASGGTGYVDSRGFLVTGFTGSFTGVAGGLFNGTAPLDASASYMSGAPGGAPGGPVDISAVSKPVNGHYNFDFVYGSARGTFSGSRTR